MNTQTLVILAVLFLAMDLFFVALRASFIYVRIPHLGSHREKDPDGVDRTLRLLETPRLTATLRLCVVFSHFLMAGTAAMLADSLIKDKTHPAIALFILLAAGVVILLLEFFVEGRILANVESWAVRWTGLARLIDFLLRPISAMVLLALGKPDALNRTLGSVTDDELRNWVETGVEGDSLEKDERKMIYSIFQLGDTLCREIMIPRIDVLALDASSTIEEAIKVIQDSGHSRMPVYQDVIDNIIGLLYAKDLLGASTHDREMKLSSMKNLIRPAYFIPEAKKADELLSEMLARSVHMAIVIDEYGGMAGLVTLEDIVEEIVGEIRDEYDQSEEMPFTQTSEDEFLFQARISLDDFNEILNTHLANEIADTLGGWMYGEIGKVPAGGEEVVVEGWRLKVEQISGRRIRLVRASRVAAENESENADDVE